MIPPWALLCPTQVCSNRLPSLTRALAEVRMRASLFVVMALCVVLCAGTLLSYAKDSHSTDEDERVGMALYYLTMYTLTVLCCGTAAGQF